MTARSIAYRIALTSALVAFGGVALSACVADETDGVGRDNTVVTGGDHEQIDERSTFTRYDLQIGATVRVCRVERGLNNRSGAGTNYRVLRVLRGGTVARTIRREGNWYYIYLGGDSRGWSYGRYLCLAEAAPSERPPDQPPPAQPNPNPNPNPSPSGPSASGNQRVILDTARGFVGFSYWWGGAAFSVGSREFGQCVSSTYSGHRGRYGADCSGFVAKVWHLPQALPMEANKHPFSTYHFLNNRTVWSAVDRSATRAADALVYRSGSRGHILVFERGDAWGQAWTFESRGCSSGVTHNLRSISSSYRARRRHGL